MVKHDNFLFLEIDCHLSYLLLGRNILILFPLLAHLQNPDFAHMVIIIKVVFCSIDALRLVFHKSNASVNNFIISIDVDFSGLLTDLFNTFDQSIVITIRIKCDYSQAAIDLHYLFPMRHLSRAVELYTFELVRISIFSLELIASVLVKIADFLDLQLLVILYY